MMVFIIYQQWCLIAKSSRPKCYLIKTHTWLFNYVSTAATSPLLFCVSLSNLHALIIVVVIFFASLNSFGLVHRILFVSHPDSTLIIAKIVHTSVDVVVDHLTSLQECLLYVKCRFCGSFEEYQSIFLCKSLAFFGADLSAIIQIRLVPNEHDHYIRIPVLSYLFQPSC